jgi:hypothetical protein
MAESTAAATAISWFPVFMLLLGSIIALAIGAIDNRRILRRDREAREDARRDKLLEQRNEFQRDCLVQLQEAMFELTRATTLMHFHDMRNYATTGSWQTQMYPEDIDERERALNGRTAMLVVRVRDDLVRKLVQQIKDIAAQATTFSTSKDEAQLQMRQLHEKQVEMNQRIGELLRTMHDEQTRLLEGKA